jgi:hypothetical protein
VRTVTGLLLCLAACSSPPQTRQVLALGDSDRVVVTYRQANGFTQVLRSPTTQPPPASVANYYERVLSIRDLQQVLDAFATLEFFDHARAKDAPKTNALLAVHVNGSSHVWPSVTQSQEELARFHDCLQLFQHVFNGSGGLQRAEGREKEAFLRDLEASQQGRNQAQPQGQRPPAGK